eukprot:47709_1
MYTTIIILFSIILICNSSKILDIADYNFYFTTNHDDRPSTTQNIPLNNDNIDLNINLIDFTINIMNTKTDTSLLLLDILNDNDWNEISLISSIDNYTTIEYQPYIAISKLLNYNNA